MSKPDNKTNNLRMQSGAASRAAHWTTLEEWRGDGDVARLRGEEFFEQPERYFAAEEAARLTGKRPGALLETADFVEMGVLNNGGPDGGFSRRDFLKLSAAAMAFATAGCALRPAEKIIPYIKAPEELVPGVANYYASTLSDAAGTGVLIKTREGRPIKIEGNPDHPLSQGKLTAAGQLSLFNLYDPDRLQGPVKLSGARSPALPILWPTADAEIAVALTAAAGRAALLTGTVHGPARTRIIREFQAAFPGTRHVQTDAWTQEATRAAQNRCYGAAVLPRYRFDKAEYVLSLGSDFLGGGYSALEWSVDFGKLRKVRDGKLSKVTVVEPFLTQTGANSDVRLRVRAADVIKVALAVANDLIAHDPTLKPLRGALSQYTPDAVERELNLPAGSITDIAHDLLLHRGESLVVAAENESLQIIANYLNSMCGNDGRTVDVSAPSLQSQGSHAELLALIADMHAGKIDVLIFYGTNPGYFLPETAGFAAALGKVKTVVSLADRVDETGRYAHYVLPGLHWLENWGDAQPRAGLYSLTQPAIYPLYDNRAAEDSLLAIAKAAGAGALGKFSGGWHEFVKDTWQTHVYDARRYDAAFEQFWNSALRDGVLDTADGQAAPSRFFKMEALLAVDVPGPAANGLELLVYPSPNLGDGAHANNAWLLECPDPVSRITWTNYASLSPATAERLGLREGDIVRLAADGTEIEAPVHIQPGDADETVSLQSGWGRTLAGKVGSRAGSNAFAFRRAENNRLRAAIACTITATGRREKLPCVQGHHYLEGRPIVADAALEDYLRDPQAGHPHKHAIHSLWPEHDYPGNRWGMSIDLASCNGCNACIAACQVENNIPVVGRDMIVRGREMHWIRVDRYYRGEPENPEVCFQPMLCQHCENAPCETVCPVVATVHNEEGLNQQIYNRCVGTRYCSNNCPYKVRRFNWAEYSFAAYDAHPLRLALNPDVTVREKGVMEKCTFCVQRIREGKVKAKQFGRDVADSDIRTACQQTCPTDAITFGNFNNPQSQVARNMADERSYRVLEELNVKPSVVYWTKLRNRPSLGDGGHHDGEGEHA